MSLPKMTPTLIQRRGNSDVYLLHDSDGHGIITLSVPVDQPLMAAQIAIACNSHDALLDVAELVIGSVPETDDPVVQEVFRRIRAVIAKAKGNG